MINSQINTEDTENTNMQTLPEQSDLERKPDEQSGLHVQGHIKIFDPESGEVFIDKRNAIHYENISEAIAYSLANKGQSYIYEMHFGNGGTSVDPTGVINYLPSNTNTSNSNLYNPTFAKIVDNTSTLNADSTRNKMEVRHTPGRVYTDILVSCLLDYGSQQDKAHLITQHPLMIHILLMSLGLKHVVQMVQVD